MTALAIFNLSAFFSIATPPAGDVVITAFRLPVVARILHLQKLDEHIQVAVDPLAEVGPQIAVMIDADGRCMIDGVVHTPEQITAVFEDLVANVDGRLILKVHSDQKAQLNEVRKLIRLAAAAGINDIRFAARPIPAE